MLYYRDKSENAFFAGLLGKTIHFIERNQICDERLWRTFVQQFRLFSDGEKRVWRGEYWGKMMRGACMIASYSHDETLYQILENSVRDMLTTQDDFGRFSTYTVETEFSGWDMWGRKYVMLGFLYFLEVCRDENLSLEIRMALCRHADYIIEKIGDHKKGKLEILLTSGVWGGVNSASMLEPMVRLYQYTNEKRYLDFASYIVDRGFCADGNLIIRAFRNVRIPCEYPTVKAYEILSCFEGLVAYYQVTGIEKYRIAALNFGEKVLETEVSIIGCCGCTSEVFDHATLMQTKNDYSGVMQETCVTVTLMKYCAALLQLSGDVRYADQMENSFYNAYLGSLNLRQNKVVCGKLPDVGNAQFLPFDSYSPLIAQTRGRKVGGGLFFEDHSFYGCCACIGSAGAGIMAQTAWLCKENGFVLNHYFPGTISTLSPKQQPLTLTIRTNYPLDGKVTVTFAMQNAEQFSLAVRIPKWCRKGTLSVNGQSYPTKTGFVTLNRIWKNNDVIELCFEMPVERILPPAGAENEDLYAAYRKGVIFLAADHRITEPAISHEIQVDEYGIVKSGTFCECPEIPDCNLCVSVEQTDGTKIRLIDYATAGNTWDTDSECAVWIRKKEIGEK